MTTAARPTFDPAKGGSGVREKSLGKLSQQVSSRDLPAHLTLKERTAGQDTIDEIKERDLKAELEERERVAQLEKSKDSFKYVPSLEQTTQIRLALREARDRAKDMEGESFKDENETLTADAHPGHTIINARKMAQLDADEDFDSVVVSESDLDDDGDEEEDDPAELMAELERIKKERSVEEEKRERELKDKEESTRSRVEEVSSFAIKRRWDDDVPFKNCARDDTDSKRKLYVNDTLRQEFHKRFMDKYIR